MKSALPVAMLVISALAVSTAWADQVSDAARSLLPCNALCRQWMGLREPAELPPARAALDLHDQPPLPGSEATEDMAEPATPITAAPMLPVRRAQAARTRPPIVAILPPARPRRVAGGERIAAIRDDVPPLPVARPKVFRAPVTLAIATPAPASDVEHRRPAAAAATPSAPAIVAPPPVLSAVVATQDESPLITALPPIQTMQPAPAALPPTVPSEATVALPAATEGLAADVAVAAPPTVDLPHSVAAATPVPTPAPVSEAPAVVANAETVVPRVADSLIASVEHLSDLKPDEQQPVERQSAEQTPRAVAMPPSFDVIAALLLAAPSRQ